jgi:hypothetical protein
VLADVDVEAFESLSVTVDGEVGNPPHTLAQDVHDRPDVEEPHPAARHAQVHDVQPG